MNLADLPAAFDDPIESLLGFHRRIERHLAVLARLPSALEWQGPDASVVATAASVEAFFSHAIELHHADERELLRLIEPRPRGEARDVADMLRDRVEAEHGEMDRTWRALRRPLRAVSEGVTRALPADLVEYFRASHATHIAFEETALQHAAVRRLAAAERAALARGMAARRTRAYRFQ